MVGALARATSPPSGSRCTSTTRAARRWPNVAAGLELGIAASTLAGGLGGCPFAPGATGNLATEQLVALLDRHGIAPGVDLDRLTAAGAGLARCSGLTCSDTPIQRADGKWAFTTRARSAACKRTSLVVMARDALDQKRRRGAAPDAVASTCNRLGIAARKYTIETGIRAGGMRPPLRRRPGCAWPADRQPRRARTRPAARRDARPAKVGGETPRRPQRQPKRLCRNLASLEAGPAGVGVDDAEELDLLAVPEQAPRDSTTTAPPSE